MLLRNLKCAMTSKAEISLEQARKIAEEQAKMNLSSLGSAGGSFLQPSYLEAENCWMFFRDKGISVPADAHLGIEWAYVVSKRGKFSLVQDFSSDSEKLHDYLKKMSDYFARTRE